MRLLTSVLAVFILLALAAVPASAGILSFTLDPSNGAIAGDAGQVIGWGLTIQNDTAYWLVITSVSFDQTTSIGDFADFLAPQFFSYAVAPGGTWTQAFDAAGSQGIGSYVIDGGFASPGDLATGNLDVLYDLHTIDPTAPDYDLFSDAVTGAQVLLAASVTYQQSPEPASIATAMTGLALLGLVKRAYRRC